MSSFSDKKIVTEPLAIGEIEYFGFSEIEKMAARLAAWQQFALASEVIVTGKSQLDDEAGKLAYPAVAKKKDVHSEITKAVIPVAGLGTRFLPATKSLPKEIMTLVDRPLIQYAVDEARAAGIKKFVFVTSRGKSALEDYFDSSPALERALKMSGKTELLDMLLQTNMPSGSVAFVRQQEPLGLGHAIWCAREFVSPNEHFAVLLPDDVIASEQPCLMQMIDAHREVGGNMVAAMEVLSSMIGSYGIIDVEAGSPSGQLVRASGLVEKPRPEDAPSNLAVMGRYILGHEIFDTLGKQIAGAGGEIQLTDAIAAEIQQGRRLHGFRFRGTRFDCGSKAGFVQATIAFSLARSDLQDSVLDYLQLSAEVMQEPHIAHDVADIVSITGYRKPKAG